MWFLATEGGGLVTFTPPGVEDMVIIGWTWAAMLLILLIALLAQSGWSQQAPGGWAGMFEHIYHWVVGLANGMMGSVGKNYAPFTMTIFLLLLVSNWFGLLPGFGAVEGQEGGTPGVSLVWSMAPKPAEKKAEATPEQPPAAEGAHEATPAGEAAPTHEAAAEHEAPISLLEAPTSNLNTTLALALVSFLSFTLFGLHEHYQAVRKGGHGHHDEHHDDHANIMNTGGNAHPVEVRGRDPISSTLLGFISWLGHFVQPTPMLWNSMDGALKYLLVPPMCVLFIGLNIVEELARVISLTLRLFGNIAGEHQVKVGLFIVMGVFGGMAMSGLQENLFMAGTNGVLSLVIWGISVFVTLIGSLAGFVQAMVFMLLTMSYISHAVALEH